MYKNDYYRDNQNRIKQKRNFESAQVVFNIIKREHGTIFVYICIMNIEKEYF